ncbi:MAG: hypothetical protein N2515_02300 [Deltaproteobacteria bacterium]|nr:hypothetical protein [Sandaracinaceae bacterium]MCX7807416.1 hypothetical protein [Deltaproteobacteria bacterium]MDW8247522.1 hypothetical protein [Sandaracinaceae bacterium]
MSALPFEVRFARHCLLPEIGAEGQRRLCSLSVWSDPKDPASSYAALWLGRSGFLWEPGGLRLDMPPALNKDPLFAEVDAAIRSGLASVECMRRHLGLTERFGCALVLDEAI